MLRRPHSRLTPALFRHLRAASLALVLSVLAPAAEAPAQAPPHGAGDSLLSPARLREDARVARAALVESQVGRTWFQSAAAFDAGFDALERDLAVPMSRAAFHRRLAPLVAALGHGHVTLERPVAGVGYRTRLLDSTGRYLPFALRIVDRRAYVLADLSDAGDSRRIARGAELVAVDGMPVGALLDTMQRYLSADGRNTSYKRYQLGTYWRFHELLALLHGPRATSRVLVRPAVHAAPPVARGGRRAGTAPEGALVTVVVRHATPRELHDRFAARTGGGLDDFPPAVRLAFLDRRAAHLTVSSFYEGLLPNGDGDFGAAFARAFRAVADSGVTDLVIDVRGNEGGNGQLPPLLYSYLAARPFRLAGRAVVAGPSLSWLRYAADPSDEIKAFAAAPRDFLDRTPDGLWALKAQFDSTRVRRYAPGADRFAGRVYVLTDGGSFSATNGFVSLALTGRRQAGRAVTFVGEEPGGDHRAGRVSGGVQQALALPNTGERLTLSLTGGVPDAGAAPPPRVRLPEVRVQPDGRDIAAGTDRVLETTRALIARARRVAAANPARAGAARDMGRQR